MSQTGYGGGDVGDMAQGSVKIRGREVREHRGGKGCQVSWKWEVIWERGD